MKYSNIYIAYALAVLHHGWFWLGIWVIYYLQFTTVAGIGLLESIMIVTKTGLEIPTGALADLLGKKKTLIISFGFVALGSFLMGFASDVFQLAVSIIFLTIGGALYSGTHEALIYDSLFDMNLEDSYDRVISNNNSIVLVGFALFSVIGGYMYSFSNSLPFYSQGILALLGLIVACMLKEPLVDSESFSSANYLNQLRQGFIQLFRKPTVRTRTVLLLFLSIPVVVGYHSLNDLLAVEFGFQPHQLGWLAGIAFITSSVTSLLSPYLKKITGLELGIIVISLFISLSFQISPILSLYLGGISIIVRLSLQAIFDNYTSEYINSQTTSEFRATTISTFAMLKELPYVFLAVGLGYLVDLSSASQVALYLGIAMLIIVITSSFVFKGERQRI